MRVKVSISNKQTAVKIPAGIRLLVRRCCHAVLINEGYDGDFEVNISFVDDEQIRILNNDYRKKNIATDVLSFPLMENGVFDINPETNAQMLGDIVISLETASMQARNYEHTLQRELGFLAVHSMLHLLGYDHEAGPIDEIKMREQEEFILKQLGLSRSESIEVYDE